MLLSNKILRIIVLLWMFAALSACVVAGPPRGQYPTMTYIEWYYYPDYEVYYQPVEHYYYYSVGGVWRRSSQLPPGWVLTGQRPVRLELSSLPYSDHANHRRRFPPAQIVRPGNGRHNHDDRREPHNRPGQGDERRPMVDRKEGQNPYIPHSKEVKHKDEVAPEKLKKGESYEAYRKGTLREMKDAREEIPAEKVTDQTEPDTGKQLKQEPYSKEQGGNSRDEKRSRQGEKRSDRENKKVGNGRQRKNDDEPDETGDDKKERDGNKNKNWLKYR